jgi:predicted Rossmann fold flavoprotein
MGGGVPRPKTAADDFGPAGRSSDPNQPPESPVEHRLFDVAIVGAGAAGLATAIFARRLNPSLSVLLLDSAARPGAKILVSGGSRCNVTNVAVAERDFNGGKPTTIRRVLRAFPPQDVVAWFGSLGVHLHEEAHGKLFPDSNRARDVLNALLDEVKAAGAGLHSSTRVEDVRADIPFTLQTTRGPVRASSVVLATGGLSLPKTGSDGGGLDIARRLGHTIVPTTPALVPLVDGDEPWHRALTGVSQEAELALWIDGSIARRLRGSLLWTHFGSSGPVILDMSRHWLRAQLENRNPRLTLNLIPGRSFEWLEQEWRDWTASRPRVSLQGVLGGLMPAAIGVCILERLSLDSAIPLANLSRTDRRRLIHALVEWPMTIAGSRGYNYAEVTAGGIALDEIDPATMESRRCPRLHFVGEMLDVDGRIGGFNFQWSWTSARVAANAIAKR